MGTPAIKRVSSKKTVVLSDMDQIADEFLIPEIRSISTNIILDENRAQYGRVPKNIVNRIDIDRRKYNEVKPNEAERLASAAGKNIVFADFKRNIRFHYTAPSDLAEAVDFAYKKLRGMLARRSGFARRSIYFYASDWADRSRSSEFDDYGALKRWIDATQGFAKVYILGPPTEDRRKRIYERAGGKKQSSKWIKTERGISSGKEISRYKFLNQAAKTKVARDSGTDYLRNSSKGVVLRATHRTYKSGRTASKYEVQVARAIHETVKAATQRRYRALHVVYKFTKPRRALPEGQRNTSKRWGTFIPVLEIRNSSRGMGKHR